MNLVIITRSAGDNTQTTGVLHVLNDKSQIIFSCLTLELPWINNQKKISCIPSGRYSVIPRTSAKFGKHFQILEVPQRNYILFHFGNYVTQIAGCILVGATLQELDGKNGLDLTNSVDTLNRLLTLCAPGFNLIIK